MRLQRAMSLAGVASRRKAEELIELGFVTVNGKVVSELGAKVDVYTDKIKVEGKLIQPLQERLYVLLNKPRSVVCTKKDPEGRKTVMDFLPPGLVNLNPVGRLDYDSEGVILMTNDGPLVDRILHPRYGIKKKYHLKIKGFPSQAVLAKLKRGVTLEDGPGKLESVKVLKRLEDRTWLEVEIVEGRNRFLRRLFMRVDFLVDRLRRVSVGPIEMGTLPMGKWRYLTEKEVFALYQAAGLDPDLAL